MPIVAVSDELIIRPLGDSALVVQVSPPDPGDALDLVLSVRDRLLAAHIPGVVELATAYETVAVFYEAPAVSTSAGQSPFDALTAEVKRVLAPGLSATTRGEDQAVEIPVWYGGDLGIDLAEVARAAGLNEAEVIARHSAAPYRVACIGFTPGFPYLTGLPAELATPRRATPRTQVPAGSVGIGGSQTGIYPLVSPGGWNIIGRTPLKLFSAERPPPALLTPGDHVRFRPITADEFRDWAE